VLHTRTGGLRGTPLKYKVEVHLKYKNDGVVLVWNKEVCYFEEILDFH
jgi:hypothetical protein